MSEKNNESPAIVDAINDLTRVTLAIHGKFASKSEAMRKLAELAIPPSRIAAILAVPTSEVTSALAKARKRADAEVGVRQISTIAGSSYASPTHTASSGEKDNG